MFRHLLVLQLLIVVSFSITSQAKDLTSFDKVVELEQSISGTHEFNFISGGNTFPMYQEIKAKYCQIDVHTYAKGIGIVFSEKYDLIKYFAYRRPGKYRGTYGTYVGAKSLLKGKWKIFFNERERRDVMASKLQKLSHLCKKRKVRKHYRKIQKDLKEEVTWVGNLFNGDLHTNSVVNTNEQNKVASLDGRQGLIERIESLENAKESIYLQYMIFRGDKLGRFFAEKLAEKKAEGIDVRIIVDAFGSGPMDIPQSKVDKRNTPKMLKNLMAAGIRVFGFNCDGDKGLRGLFRDEIGGVDITKLIRRHHEKFWVVDNELAIAGGINLSQEYFSLTGEDVRTWKDHDLSVKGPIVKDFKDRFLSNWVEYSVDFKSYKKDKKCFNTFNPITEKEEYEKFKKEHTVEYTPYEKEEDIAAYEIVEENINRFLKGDKFLDSVFLHENTRYRSVDGLRVVHSDPEAGENYTHEAYIQLINKAQKEIHLANAYFNPPEDLMEALQNALKRGVKIKFYTNGEEYNDLPLFTLLGRMYYKSLYEAAVEGGDEDNFEMYEWDGTIGDSDSVTVSMAHTKYMIVDGKFGINGSHNLSYSSMNNSEILLLFDGAEIARDLIDQFEFDLEHTHRVTPEQMIEFRKPKRVRHRIRNFFLKYIVGKLA
jgi:phosphatidylserine/phosphatidylglycerophosphate/cardiolipin synthase-like enzyme